MVYLDCLYCRITLGIPEKTEHRILTVSEDSIEVQCLECMKKRRGRIEWLEAED